VILLDPDSLAGLGIDPGILQSFRHRLPKRFHLQAPVRLSNESIFEA
jgi:hypothetical protein